MCLRDQIFRVLLEHFISEVVRKWKWDKSSTFCYKFCEQMLEDFYHWFCAKVAAEAIAIFLLVYFIDRKSVV